MTTVRRPFLVLLSASALVGAVMFSSAAHADVVRGSGVATTVHRDVGSFTGIAVGGDFAVTVRIGDREGVDIRADDNIAPLVETTLHGSGNDRVLQIELARNVRVEPRTPIVVTVDAKRVERLALGGAGSIDARAIRSPKLETAIGGSGQITLADLDVGDLSVAIGGSGNFRGDGHAKKLGVRVGGSGRCDADRIAADDVSVAVAGSGDARVHAERALSASIAGSGDVYYTGAAVPQVAIAGSGRLKKL